MSRGVRVFLFLSGVWIFFSWGFRLYILSVRWDAHPNTTLLSASIFLLMGGFFIFMSIAGAKATSRHYVVLMGSSVLIVGFWFIRIMRRMFSLTVDPNSRSHLHLAVTFLVVGVILFVIGLRGRKKIMEAPHAHA